MPAIEPVMKQLGPIRAEELLKTIGFAIMFDAAGRRLAAWILWRNACSLIQEALAEIKSTP